MMRNQLSDSILRKCARCEQEKHCEFSHFSPPKAGFERKMFMDEQGRLWNGITCPDCMVEYHREWRRRRREEEKEEEDV